MTVSCQPTSDSTPSAETARAFSPGSARYRNYHPSLGRWIERDPIGYADGMSLTGYVAENPVVYADALGLKLTGFDGCTNTQKAALEAADKALTNWLDGAVKQFRSWDPDTVFARYITQNGQPAPGSRQRYQQYYNDMLVKWKKVQDRLAGGLKAVCTCETDPKDPTKKASVYPPLSDTIYIWDPFFGQGMNTTNQFPILLDEITHLDGATHLNQNWSLQTGITDIAVPPKDTDHFLWFTTAGVRSTLENLIWRPLFYPRPSEGK